MTYSKVFNKVRYCSSTLPLNVFPKIHCENCPWWIKSLTIQPLNMFLYQTSYCHGYPGRKNKMKITDRYCPWKCLLGKAQLRLLYLSELWLLRFEFSLKGKHPWPHQKLHSDQLSGKFIGFQLHSSLSMVRPCLLTHGTFFNPFGNWVMLTAKCKRTINILIRLVDQSLSHFLMTAWHWFDDIIGSSNLPFQCN